MAYQISQADKDTFNVAVGDAIRELRTKAGLTQSKLAMASKLPCSCIVHAEGGFGFPPIALARIAEGLDCLEDELIPTEATS